MKIAIKLIEKILKILTKILYKCLPIQKGRIVCTSFNGHYSDSPKYIARKIKELKPDADIIWLVDEKMLTETEKEFKAVQIDSFLGGCYAASAEIRIDNVYGDSALSVTSGPKIKIIKAKLMRWLSAKKRQKLYTTWHGTPIKRMGRDQIGSNITDFLCDNATMILDNQYTLDIMQHLTFGKLKMVLLGLPRNDLLWIDTEEQIRIKKKLGLPLERKVLLFAPSFRHDGNDLVQKNIQRSGLDQLKQIDFDTLFSTLQRKFGGEWTLVCRFHYHVEAMVNWQELTERYEGRVINGNGYDDMAEYLTCSDVLLTDVSSCAFDFSLTGRPCLLFFPDYEYYKEQERGFYYPVEKLPYLLSKNFEELINIIDKFNIEKYKKDLNNMFIELGFIHDNTAAEKVAKYILQENNLL